MTIDTIIRMGPVIPVVIIEDIDHAVPLADALADGGINVIEVTLRSAAALDCIAAIADQRPEMTLGAGTILTPGQMQEMPGQISPSHPGLSRLVKSSTQSNLPLLPGAATASEMMALMADGITAMKFFPASVAGGVDYLQALTFPLLMLSSAPPAGYHHKQHLIGWRFRMLSALAARGWRRRIRLPPAILPRSSPGRVPALILLL